MLPSASFENSSRVSGECRLSLVPAHQITAWCLARVSATYASRRSSPRSSITCCSKWRLNAAPSSPTSTVCLYPVDGIVERHGFPLPDPGRMPQERAVDDRELEALAAMDRQHLDRLGVRFEPPSALLLTLVAIRVRDALGQPAAQRGDPESLGARGTVQQLREVAHVGQPALAVAATRARGRPGPRRP